MTQIDAYYRALQLYRSELGDRRDCLRDRNSLIGAQGEESLSVTYANCTVDEEWIEAIERGLVHIEKAIKQDRQFIFSNGEVVPIEKVKNVSKESVEHLARHAELISRAEEGEDLVPDKLFTVERISDYTIYENRFLYMLLCYLRDFVSLRYKKLLELTNCYNGSLALNRQMTVFNRSLNFSLTMSDEKKDDPYLRERNPAKTLIDRIDLILKTVTAFLATPLMESASKVAMLKPPITKTNILKMDNDFKGAMALYEYIIAYDKEGFTVEEQTQDISPFEGELADDMAEAELLIAFIVYQYGLGITGELKAAHELDLAEARQAELRQRTEQLEAIRHRLERDEITHEEYILELEKQVRALQNEVDRIQPLYSELDDFRANERRLNAELSERHEEIKRLETDLSLINERHDEATAALSAAHRAEINELIARQHTEQNELQARHRAELDAARAEVNEHDRRAAEIERRFAELTEERNYLQARVYGQRFAQNDISESERLSMTDKESFDRLEEDLEAFVRFYKRQWTLAKRQIRRDLININYIKEKNGKK